MDVGDLDRCAGTSVAELQEIRAPGDHDLPRAGELGKAVIGAAEEQPESRLVRYDLAERRRSVEVEALDDYAVSADGARLARTRA